MVTWSRPSVGGVRMAPGGTTAGTGRRRSSGRSPAPVQTNEQRNLIFEQYRAGTISQAQAIGQIQGVQARTAFESKIAAAKAAEQKAAEQKAAEAAIAAAKTFAEKQKLARSYVDTKRAELEKRKILQTRAKLIGQGAKEQKVTSRDVKTGDKLVVTQWMLRNGNRVERIENKTKGTITYSSFARPKAGGSVVRTGGVTVGGGPTVTEIIKDLKSSNLTPFLDKAGNVIKFGSKITQKSYPYTDAGIKAFNNDMKSSGSMFKQYIKNYTDTYGMSIKPAEKPTPIPKLKDLKLSIFKIMTGKKLTNKEALKLYRKYDNINMKNAKLLTIAGPIVGTVIPGGQIPGAAIWALGEIAGKQDRAIKSNEKLTLKEIGSIAKDAAIMGALMGAGGKILKQGGNIISKRVILGSALKNIESQAARAAINHGGVLIKFIGYSGKNLITTYFMKDMIGNVFDVTAAVKNGEFKSALRNAIETGASIGGYIGGSKLAGGLTKAGLFVSGRLKPTVPEFAQKKTQLDVMAKQLLSEGKIVLTRRTVYETGKGLSPRKDAWLDSKIKNPTKSIFWRFDKTLSPKDQAISPLPLFTKSKTGYLKMFKANWNKNKGMGLIKRYIKTSAETPLVEDVVIRKIINLKDIKDVNLRKSVIKQYATTGKLDKATQAKILKNPKFGISDKNREFGFHDENEFVTRTGFKFKGRTDISWTYDPTLKEYVPVVESLKTTNRMRNFLDVLRKKKIITRTDAKFITDNYALKTEFKAGSILPNKHSYTHMKQVESNIVKLMNKYPEYNSYWKKQYGSIAKAREAMKQAMWHDIGKGESASQAFGTAHGEKVWRVWKAGLLPKGIKLQPKVAKAIKKHETLDPRKLWYKIQNKVKLITPEEKIVATADRLDLVRFGIKIDLKRLPLSDSIKRLGLKTKFVDYPSKFNKIINKIRLDKGVTKLDIKRLLKYAKTAGISAVKKLTYKTDKWKSYTSAKYKNSYKAGWTAGKRANIKAPTNYNAKYKGVQSAYTAGYRDSYSGKYRLNYKTGEYKRPVLRKIKRPIKRPSKRPIKRPTKRPTKRPIKRPTKRPYGRPVPRKPIKRPYGRPVPRKPIKTPPEYPFKLPRGFTKRKLSKKTPVYMIKAKKRGKMVNLAARPLIKKDALNYLAYRLDNDLLRTAYLVPLGSSKEVIRLPPKMAGYFNKNKKKFRGFKTRQGKKKILAFGFIEKKKYVGDVKSEIKALHIARKEAKRNVRRKSTKTKAKTSSRKAPVKRKVVRRRVINRKSKTSALVKRQALILAKKRRLRALKLARAKARLKALRNKKGMLKSKNSNIKKKRVVVKRKTPVRKKRVVKRKSKSVFPSFWG